MKRLTIRNSFGEVTVSGKDDDDIQRKYHEIAKRLAELEDKLEVGQLVELPCKVGDVIYVVPGEESYRLNKLSNLSDHNRIYKTIVEEIRFNFSGYLLMLKGDFISVQVDIFFGVTWFLTEQEAEARLKKLQEENK